MFLKFRPLEAPVRYRFKDPDTGMFFHSHDQLDLINQIQSYRSQNKLETLDELPTVIENYLCGLPENTGKCYPRELKRSLMESVKGGVVVLKNLAFKSFATQQEADSRGSQCKSCKFNVFPDKKGFPAWADDVAIMMVGERKSKHHNDLGNCEVCTCPLRSKVFHGGILEPFPEDQVKKLKSVNCWQLKLSGQDK